LKTGIILATISLLAYGGLVGLHLQTGTLRDEHTPTTLAWYGVVFAAYLASIFWAERRKSASLTIIWGGAIAFRLLLLFTTPSLSDDVYRYLWDGYVTNHGVSPYAYPIDSPELDHLDIPLRALANHSWMASPYLPTAQFLFTGLTRWLPLHPAIFQISMVIFDLLTGLLLINLLNLSRLPTQRVLLYLWNPLVIIEVAHGAHLDAWMIFLTMLSLWLTFSSNRSKMSTWLAPVTLALATLTKFMPVLLLPILFWRWRWGQLVLYGLVTFVLLFPFGLQAGWGLTGPLDGSGLFGAVRIYADQWNFNSGLFHWLEANYLPDLGVVETFEWAKRLALLALLAITVVVWFQARRRPDVRPALRLMAVPFMAYLLLTTTVHPWYALILLAFIPFLPPASAESPWRWLSVAPWLYLSAALPLSYLTYLNPLDFRELEWVRRVEWLPTLALLAVWMMGSMVRRLMVKHSNG
jgi:alpha-1,6-mannosyltransferase